MRALTFTVLFGWFASVAWSSPALAGPDPHAEMAAALAAQADLRLPAPVLPAIAVGPRHAAAGSAVKRGSDARSAEGATRAAANAAEATEAANRVSQRAQAQAASQALAHQAQAAAAAAAGQAQSQAAKARAAHPHPR
jgi:hypothetical protein